MVKRKNPAAVALAKFRLKSMTAEERQRVAAKGGKAAWKNVSAAERSRIMKERRKERRGR